jgi:diacylglycerol kinase (ATP)
VAAGRTAELDAVRVVPDGPPAADGAGERWFTGVLGAGFDAAVNERANRMRWPRGPRRYDLAVFAELYRLRPRSVVLTLDGQREEVEVTLVAVGNGPQYGGGFQICPDARPNDGLLDVCVVGPLSRAQLVRFKPLARTGEHVTLPMVRVLRGRQLRLEAPDVVAYADGERVGPLPLTLTCVPGALRVLLPAAP